LPVDHRRLVSQALSRAAVAQDLIQFEIADFDDIYAAYELGVRDIDILAASSGR
jgi:hypothetical protein